MALRKYRREAGDIAQQATLNRIARTTPLTMDQASPDGLTSSAEKLGHALTALYDHGTVIASTFHVDRLAIWEEMLARCKGQRR